MNQFIITERAGPVATITLNRPERHNSLIPALLEELLAVLEQLRSEPELRALVLQAAGRSFSTGGDVRGFFTASDLAAYSSQIVGLLNQVMLALISFPTPVIAAVHGIVTGGSLGLVLAADIVLVAPQASFTPYYTSVGFSPDGGWSVLLPQRIGQLRAAEVLLCDQSISAEQAVAWGLASRLVAAEQLHAEAQALAQRIAMQLPGSTRRVRQLLWGDTAFIAARLEEERQHFVAQIVSSEAQQGMQRFLDQLKGRQGQ